MSSSESFWKEVSAWHLNPRQPPDFNDLAVFQSWFETECCDVAFDALDELLVKDA